MNKNKIIINKFKINQIVIKSIKVVYHKNRIMNYLRHNKIITKHNYNNNNKIVVYFNNSQNK
jgi:hypothetical protein